MDLPSDIQLERSIIGSCFGEDTSRLATARSVIGEDHFTLDINRRMWRCLCRLADAGRALSATEVYSDMVANRESIGPGFISDFIVDDWWAFDRYLPRLVELTKRRRLVVRGSALMHAAADQLTPIDEVAGSARAGIDADLDGVNLNEPETIGEIVEAAGGVDRFLAATNGVETPWHQVNYCIGGGWQPGELVLVAARPSMGKTAFALNACMHAAIRGTHTVFYSCEMSRESITKRLICMRANLNYHSLIRADLTFVERRAVQETLAWLDTIPLRIIGASGRTAFAIRSHSERLSRRGRCGMIAVDYIGLVRGSDATENRNKQLGEICRQLKELATQLKIPALVLAQLNRSTETRNDKRPMMGDLRDSGELEEHADLIALLHRPGYYDRRNPDIQLVAEVIIAKQRNGDTPVIQLEFHRTNGRFVDPEDNANRYAESA